MSLNMSTLIETTHTTFGDKTRGKILRSSLQLFNGNGFDRVTTAQIAKTAKILDGTLWYHFKAKNDLVLAHLGALEKRLATHLSAPVAEEPEVLLAHFFDSFTILWDFRYLLRDPLQAIQDDEGIKGRLKRTYELVEGKIEDRIKAASQQGLLNLSGMEAHSLAVSCFMIGRYWLDYTRIRGESDVESSVELKLGILQVLTLLRPYLSEHTKLQFSAIAVSELIDSF